jgi:hypothetical protein
MDEIGHKPQAPRVDGEESLKPYRRPKLTPLGSIHSLVRTNPGVGADGGTHMSNTAAS